MPAIDKNATPTEKQVQVRELFSSASVYAKGAVADPDLKKEYQKKASSGNTAFNIAFRDYLKAPVVKKIDTGYYNGKPGSTIAVKATDDSTTPQIHWWKKAMPF